MVRRWTCLGLAGAASMAAGLFLPICVDYPWEGGDYGPPVYVYILRPVEPPECDDPNCGQPHCADEHAWLWIVPTVQAIFAALVFATAWASIRATRAWLPAGLWLLCWTGLFAPYAAAMMDTPPRAHIAVWGWLAAALGGGCAVVASLFARARARRAPAIDVAAFD